MRHRFPFSLLALLLATVSTFADESPHAPQRPDRFAIIFNMGYAGDQLPTEPEAFEALIRGVKSAGFNVVLCQWEPWRAEICQKHDLKIFVDLLAPPHHVYKNVEGCEKLCKQLRDNDTVYGYHVWSDNIGNTYPGRSRDVANVHRCDPTHPVYVGTYRMSRVNRVEKPDLIGYYDFHWKRGGHWGHLERARQVATSKDARFLRYCDASPGLVGKGNPNRAGYTIATSIPFGLKGYLFHYAGGVVDPATGKLDALGEDLKKVNAAFAPLGPVLLELGNPQAVYSTRVTRSAKDDPIEGEPMVPAGLTAIPDDHWLQVAAGEVLLGFFQDQQQRDVVALASHNAYQAQDVKLTQQKAPRATERFDGESGQWKPVPLSGGEAQIAVPPAAVELLRFAK